MLCAILHTFLPSLFCASSPFLTLPPSFTPFLPPSLPPLSPTFLPPSLHPFLPLSLLLITRYVPTDWVDKQELTVEEVNDLNRRNMELCHHLGQCSSVFAPFQHGNFTCIFIKEVCLSVCPSV